MAIRRSRRPRSVRLEAGTATHTGRIRASNQDAVGMVDDLFVVADGMGGHRGGEVAAAEAGVGDLNGSLAGQLAVVFGETDFSAAAKIVLTISPQSAGETTVRLGMERIIDASSSP